jgi:hypothetical protein
MANPTNAEISASRAVAIGALAWAPLATALPTDAVTALAAAYKGLGYIGTGGITRPRDITVDDQKDMNGDTVYSLQTDFSRTYQAELLQNENVDIKKMIFGSANVVITAKTATTGARISVADKGTPALHGVLVATTFDGLKSHREVVGDAQPVAVEQGPLVGTAIRSYTVTWKVFRDSSGTWVNEYDDDGVFP